LSIMEDESLRELLLRAEAVIEGASDTSDHVLLDRGKGEDVCFEETPDKEVQKLRHEVLRLREELVTKERSCRTLKATMERMLNASKSSATHRVHHASTILPTASSLRQSINQIDL